MIPGVVDDSAVFLPTDLSDGSPVLFDYAATDRTGVQQASFGLPGVFIRADADQPDIAAVIDHYAGTDSADLRATDLRGQPVAYADEPPGTEGDGKTTLPTFAMSFTLAEPTTTLPDGVAALVPAMETAAVVDAKVDTLRGQDAEPFTVRLATGGCRTASTSTSTSPWGSSTWTLPSRCPSPAAEAGSPHPT